MPAWRNPKHVANGDLDFTLHFSGPLLLQVDRGLRITFLAGIHVGCFELFAKEGIRSVADLKGRTVGIQALETSQHVFLSAMATLVGLNPAKDIEWVTSASVKPIELFAEGKIDAFLGTSSRTPTFACAEHRSCHRQQRAGSPMVAVFLLHVGGKSRIRPKKSHRH